MQLPVQERPSWQILNQTAHILLWWLLSMFFDHHNWSIGWTLADSNDFCALWEPFRMYDTWRVSISSAKNIHIGYEESHYCLYWSIEVRIGNPAQSTHETSNKEQRAIVEHQAKHIHRTKHRSTKWPKWCYLHLCEVPDGNCYMVVRSCGSQEQQQQVT